MRLPGIEPPASRHLLSAEGRTRAALAPRRRGERARGVSGRAEAGPLGVDDLQQKKGLGRQVIPHVPIPRWTARRPHHRDRSSLSRALRALNAQEGTKLDPVSGRQKVDVAWPGTEEGDPGDAGVTARPRDQRLPDDPHLPAPILLRPTVACGDGTPALTQRYLGVPPFTRMVRRSRFGSL